jgi:hypothetical protein
VVRFAGAERGTARWTEKDGTARWMDVYREAVDLGEALTISEP